MLHRCKCPIKVRFILPYRKDRKNLPFCLVIRYFLRVSIARRISDMTKELDLLVHTLATYPEMSNPIKMEVGIEECLHIEFEYNKSK